MSYSLGHNVRVEHKLKTEIYKRGYTIGEFANEIGINRWTLNHIFKGSVPRGDTVYHISQGLKITYEEAKELCV